MDLPVIDTPVFPRWVWIEEITYSHIPIATLITAFMILAPIYEYIGYRRKDLRWDRLAKGLIWFSMILFSPGAALGTGIPVFIIGTYPEFWARWSNLFFWPLVVQFGFFLFEVFFLFFGYYLTWEALMNRKRLHIFFGVMAALFGLAVQFVWDALGGYMLTPGEVALPATTEPVAWSAAAFFNPSFPYLFIHRFFGNISYTMLLVGGVFALRHVSKRNSPANRQYFGWAADVTFTIGLLAFFVMPAIGWTYARVIKAEAPVAFAAIMGGHTAPFFTFKMGLITFFLLFAGTYLALRHRRKALHVALTLGVLNIGWIVVYHPALDWLGPNATLWRGVCFAVLVGMAAWFWVARGRSRAEHRGWQYLRMAVGLAAMLTFAIGGFVRERSKSPDTVYGEILKPEATHMEKDRYLLYDKCVRCHNDGHPTPLDFERADVEDWSQVVARERQRDGAPPISGEEAKRIVQFLEEHYP